MSNITSSPLKAPESQGFTPRSSSPTPLPRPAAIQPPTARRIGTLGRISAKHASPASVGVSSTSETPPKQELNELAPISVPVSSSQPVTTGVPRKKIGVLGGGKPDPAIPHADGTTVVPRTNTAETKAPCIQASAPEIPTVSTNSPTPSSTLLSEADIEDHEANQKREELKDRLEKQARVTQNKKRRF